MVVNSYTQPIHGRLEQYFWSFLNHKLIIVYDNGKGKYFVFLIIGARIVENEFRRANHVTMAYRRSFHALYFITKLGLLIDYWNSTFEAY